MDNLRENFRNWLTKQGLSEKTETGILLLTMAVLKTVHVYYCLVAVKI